MVEGYSGTTLAELVWKGNYPFPSSARVVEGYSRATLAELVWKGNYPFPSSAKVVEGYSGTTLAELVWKGNYPFPSSARLVEGYSGTTLAELVWKGTYPFPSSARVVERSGVASKLTVLREKRLAARCGMHKKNQEISLGRWKNRSAIDNKQNPVLGPSDPSLQSILACSLNNSLARVQSSK